MPGGTVFPLRDNQKLVLRAWVSGSWDRQWLRTSTSMAGYTSWADHGPNGVPSHFVGADGGRQRLLLNTEGYGIHNSSALDGSLLT